MQGQILNLLFFFYNKSMNLSLFFTSENLFASSCAFISSFRSISCLFSFSDSVFIFSRTIFVSFCDKNLLNTSFVSITPAKNIDYHWYQFLKNPSKINIKSSPTYYQKKSLAQEVRQKSDISERRSKG